MVIEERNGYSVAPGGYAHHLPMILRRIEVAFQAGVGRRVCGDCGCLCRPYEGCPGCRARQMGAR